MYSRQTPLYATASRRGTKTYPAQQGIQGSEIPTGHG